MKIKDFLDFIKETDGSFGVIDSCDTNYYDIRNYKLKIYVVGDDNIYTSIDELPDENVRINSWQYTEQYLDDNCLEIWCERGEK